MQETYSGAAGETRTHDLTLTKRLLYQLSYDSMGLEIRIELIFRRYEGRVLPLDDSSKKPTVAYFATTGFVVVRGVEQYRARCLLSP